MNVTPQKLASLVRKDREIAELADSATLRLMEHRWKAVQEVGNISEYARALGVAEFTVRKYVQAWTLIREENSITRDRSPSDILDLATMSTERAEAVQAVADAKGISTRRTRERHLEQVKRVQEVIRKEGTQEGRRVAKDMETFRSKARETEESRRRSTPLAALEMEAAISQATAALRRALTTARASDLSDEWITTIQESLAGVTLLAELINSALSGSSGIDWDAELAKLGDRA